MKQTKCLGHEIDENGVQPKDKKSRGHIKIESTGEHERIEIISRSVTIHGKISTETLGRNGSAPETIEEKRNVELGNRTKWRLRKNKTDVKGRPMSSPLFEGQR